MAVQEAAPREGDYGQQGACAIARMEHACVCRALSALDLELDETIGVVGGKRLASEVPASEFPRLAAHIADQPRCFPSPPVGGSDPETLRETLAGVYRCSLTVIGEFQPATPNARDYDTHLEFTLARTRHLAWVLFVQRIGHWFLVMAKAVPAQC